MVFGRMSAREGLWFSILAGNRCGVAFLINGGVQWVASVGVSLYPKVGLPCSLLGATIWLD
jgi:hypothetical protein